MSFWMNTLIKTNNNSKLRGVLQLSTSTLKSNFHLHRRIITTGTGSTHHNLKLLQLHHQTQAQTRYKATATVTTTSMSPKITTGPIFTVTYVSFTVVRISICSVFTYFVTTSIELLYILPHIRRTHHYFIYLSINKVQKLRRWKTGIQYRYVVCSINIIPTATRKAATANPLILSYPIQSLRLYIIQLRMLSKKYFQHQK